MSHAARILLDRTSDPVAACATSAAPPCVADHVALLQDEVARLKEALRVSEGRLRNQFAKLPIPTNLWRAEGDDFVLVATNELARRNFPAHLDSAIGRSSTEIFPTLPGLNEDRRRCLRENRVIHRTVEIDRGNGTRVLELTMGPQPPDHVLSHAVDITDRLNLEAQLREAEKLKAAGQLAGGIAHDFNNLLTVIIAYAQMIRMGMPAEHEDLTAVDEIEHAAERAAALTNQLLLFGRRQRSPLSPIDLNGAIRELAPLLQQLVGPGVALELALGEVPFSISADPGQLGQVLMNLVTNANQAMPDGGTVSIQTSVLELDDALRTAHADAQAGPYVRVRVTDDGHGMDADILPRIFEPFFTTRSGAEHVGLGLSTVYGIVQQWGGIIEAASVAASGSSFAIFLPALPPLAAATEGRDEIVPGDAVTETTSARRPVDVCTVLLVDDNDGLRAVARMVLARAGYRVLESSNGIDALRLLDEIDHPVDVVLSDMVMPGMGGRDLAYEVRIRYPAAVVVLMSGYMRATLEEGDPLRDDTVFVTKPFTPAVLLQAVADALAAREPVPDPAAADVAASASAAPETRAVDALINGLDAVVWEGDASTGRIHYVNRRAESLLGYPRARWHEEGFMNAITHADDRERIQALRSRCARTRVGYTSEYRVTAANGDVLWVRDVAGVISQSAGARLHIGGVLFDITEAMRTMDELRIAKEAAERADTAKSQFLALVSHELHTPLNAVIGFANVLHRNRAGNLTTQDVSYVERIGANGRQLLRIVGDMLDLTRMEAGTLVVHAVPVTLDAIVGDAMRDFAEAAAHKGLALDAVVPAGLRAISADPSRLTQVLANLLGNAIKFSTTGGVTVRVVAQADGVSPGRIEVEDTGPGIPPDQQESMFAPFRQDEHFTRRHHSGAGMGLSIARGLCDLMGFHLTLTSTIGVGSVFAVHLVSP